jgi:hypothetical protein
LMRIPPGKYRHYHAAGGPHEHGREMREHRGEAQFQRREHAEHAGRPEREHRDERSHMDRHGPARVEQRGHGGGRHH